MSVKNHIPNLLTLGNVFCGCCAIIMAFSGHLYYAPFFIFAGAGFDFLDGFAARMLNVKSELGKQLDSLGDLITFGVAPGVIVYKLMAIRLTVAHTLNSDNKLDSIENLLPFEYGMYDTVTTELSYLPLIALIIPVLSAYRLAKFNIDTRQTESFIGLPTPAVGIFFASLPLIFSYALGGVDSTRVSIPELYLNGSWLSLGTNYAWLAKIPTLAILSIVLSFLLISSIPMFSLKFKTFGWKGNELRFTFLALCVVIILAALLISFWAIAIPIIILLYIVLSIVDAYILKSNEV